MQTGYSVSPEEFHSFNNHNYAVDVGEDMPRRALGPGLHMGLSVMLDMQEEEYYCTGSQSVGIKVR